MPYKTLRRRRNQTRRAPRVISTRGNRVSIKTATAGRVTMAKPVVSAVKQIAKSVVSNNEETKYVSVQQDLSFNSRIQSASECYPLCPAVPPGNANGTLDFQRVGSVINGKYLVIKGKLQYNNAYLDTAGTQFIPPSTCRLMILSQKNVMTSGDVQTKVDVAHLLKDNVATAVARAYDGGQYDNLAPINRDLFTVHYDKRVKLNWINHQVVLTDTGVSISHNVGNDRTKYFYCKIKLGKKLYFDDGNANFPNRFAPFLCFGAVCDDGAAPWSVQTPYRLTFTSTLYFTDP